MLFFNFAVEEDSWEYRGQPRKQKSRSSNKSIQIFHWRLKLSYFRLIMQRQSSLKKVVMLRVKEKKRITSRKVGGFNYNGDLYTIGRFEGLG